MGKSTIHESNQKASNHRLILDYTQDEEIIGLIVLSAFGFYALKLVMSFRTGLLARSWKQVTAGSIFLILAQLPFLAVGIDSQVGSLLTMLGTFMRFAGVVLLTIGLRAQSRVWRLENKSVLLEQDRSGASPTFERR